MPGLTLTILAWSWSMIKTTSTGLTSFFLSERAELVPSVEVLEASAELVAAVVALVVDAVELVGGSVRPFFLPFFASFSFGKRVVTLAKGTVRTLVRLRVSISAVTDMPGRKASFSLMRIFTSNLVASWLPLLLLLAMRFRLLFFAESAISVTVPVNF